jgi:hypothetical protein
MSESATRDVIFRMQARPAPDALQNAHKFGQSLERIQLRTFSAVDKRREESAQATSRFAAASVTAEKQASTQIEAIIKQRIALRRQEISLRNQALEKTTATTTATSSATPSPGSSEADKLLVDRLQQLAELHREVGKAASEASKVAISGYDAEIVKNKELVKGLQERLTLAARVPKTTARGTKSDGTAGGVAAADKEAKAAERAEQMKVRAAEKAALQQAKIAEKASLDKLKLSEQTARKEAADRARQQKDAEREEDRLHKRHRERQRSIAMQNRKSRNEEIKEQDRAVKLTEQQMAQAQGRLQAGGNILRSGIADAGGEILKIGAGLATIGLVSEKNNEKLLRGLVLLKGANDVVSGGLKLWQKTSTIVEGYRATLDAAKTIQATLLAQQALMGVGGVKGMAAGAAGGAAANAAGGAAGVAGMSVLQKAALAAGPAIGKITTAASLLAVPLAKLTVVAGAAAMGLDMLYSKITTGSFGSRDGSVRQQAEQKIGDSLAERGIEKAKGLTDRELEIQAAGGGFLDRMGSGNTNPLASISPLGTVANAATSGLSAMRAADVNAAEYAKAEIARRRAEKTDQAGQQKAQMRANREALLAEQEAEKQEARDLVTSKLQSFDARSQATLQPSLAAIETSQGDKGTIDSANKAINAANQAITRQQEIIEQQQQAIAEAGRNGESGVEVATKIIQATKAAEQAQQAITEQQNAIQASMVAKVENRSGNKIARIDEAMAVASQERGNLDKTEVGADLQSRAEHAQKVAAMDEKLVDLAKQRRSEESAILTAKHEQAKVGLEVSRRELENTKATLQLTKDRIEAMRQSVLTAKERFGQMDEADQRRILETGEKALAGGKLDKVERQTLIDYGLGDLRNLAGKQAQEAADEIKTAKGGSFESILAASTRESMRLQEEEMRRQEKLLTQTITRKIEVQNETVINLETSAEEIVGQVDDVMKRHHEQIQKMLEANAKVQEERDARRRNKNRGLTA